MIAAAPVVVAPPEVRSMTRLIAQAFAAAEVAGHIPDGPRDEAVVAYTLAVLANPRNPGTATVLEHIDRSRTYG